MDTMLRQVVSRQLGDHLNKAARLAGALSSEEQTKVPEIFNQIVEASGSALPHRFAVGWRDLSAGVAGAGGYLISPSTLPAENPLPPGFLVNQAGARIIPRPLPSGDTIVPVWQSWPSVEWLQTETQQLTSATPTLGAATARPKMGGVAVRLSRQLTKQSDAPAIVRDLLLGAADAGLASALLNGSGASGQPLGILNTSGIGSVTGTSLGWSGVVEMEEFASLGNAEDLRVTFVGHPGVRRLLRQREKAAGSGMIWNGSEIAGHPALATTSMPDASLLAGDFSSAAIILWGPGIEVLSNPYDPTGFRAATLDLAVFIHCDIITLHSAAFAKATSIT